MNRFVWLAALAAIVAVPGLAKERIDLDEKLPVVIDPARAYVLYSGETKFPMSLIRTVDANERATWATARTAALAKAQAKSVRARKKYEDELATWNGLDPTVRALYAPPTAPVAVSDSNFAFAPPELANFVYAARPFSKSDRGFTYLIAVPPGRYTVYGPQNALSTGVFGALCMCMGSIAFDAVPGKVVSLGRFTNKFGANPIFTFERAKASDPVLPALTSIGVTPAHLVAAGKMPNYNGTLIGRLAPIEGVLAYRRDTVIDVASAKEAVALP